MSASWKNAVVARLAAGEDLEGEFDGLLLICSWPMPAQVQAQYQEFRKELMAALPAEAYVYPASTLHCTISTLRPFTAGKLDEAAATEHQARWVAVLDAARAMPEWPSGSFTLKMNAPTLEGSAGVFRYEDLDGSIEKMRACVGAAIVAHGGVPAIGSGDRSKAKPLKGSPTGEPAPHIPDIVHSTVVRWKDDVADKAAAQLAFKEVASKWEPVEITASAAVAVQETVPFMHIRTSTAPWWTSKVSKPLPPSLQWLKVAAEGAFLIALPFIYIWISIMMSGKMPGKVGSDSKLHPLAN